MAFEHVEAFAAGVRWAHGSARPLREVEGYDRHPVSMAFGAAAWAGGAVAFYGTVMAAGVTMLAFGAAARRAHAAVTKPATPQMPVL